MKHITSTAMTAGAEHACATHDAPAHHGMGTTQQQPAFRPVSRREVMAAVNTCSKHLGLNHGALVVLDALLSYLPCRDKNGQELPVSPATLLTIFASNDALCFRAKGLTDRQLRRHLHLLEVAGLIRRRDSANGKRFPIMKGGKVIGAYGLDLCPLFIQADNLLTLAQNCRNKTEELRGLRAQILQLRSACISLSLDGQMGEFVDSLRNLVRRASLTLVEARIALGQLTDILSAHETPAVMPAQEIGSDDSLPRPKETGNVATDERQPDQETVNRGAPCNTKPPSKTAKAAASGGRIVRHIEPKSDPYKKRTCATKTRRWSDLTEISSFYTEPDSARETEKIAFEFGRMLRIGPEILSIAADKLGFWQLLKIEDLIAQKIETIHNPEAWLRYMLANNHGQWRHQTTHHDIAIDR